MKGVHQIYLFAATILVAVAFFIQRSWSKDGSLYALEDLPEVQWRVLHFDRALFGGDSLDWEVLQRDFGPFLQSNPERYFWKNERENQLLNDHFTNVENLIDRELVEADLADIAARANALLDLPIPVELHFYVSGIDANAPVLYAPGSPETLSYGFVGLDNFLGAGYPGYNAITGYQRELMRQSQLPVRFAQAMIEKVNVPNYRDESLLGQMVFYGKLQLATEALCPEVSAAERLGYSPEEYAFLEDSERSIWEVLVREKLLFSTDMMVRQRLVEPAPFTKLGTAMDAEIPGRAGAYIGYKMVRSYAENHPELTLKQVLKIRDAQKFLRDAQYKP